MRDRHSVMQRFAESIAPRLPVAQKAAAGFAAVSLLLGFLASIGVFVLPRGAPWGAWVLYPLLLLFGGVGGVAATVRGRQIDRRRWELLDEPLLTGGERTSVHKDAERQRRGAATVFVMAPVLFGYWMAYQFAAPEGGSPLAFLLIVPPMLGFILGLFVTHRALGPEETRF